MALSFERSVRSARARLLGCWVLALGIEIILFIVPVANRWFRLAEIILALVIWLGLSALTWRWTAMRFSCAAITIVAVAALSLPGRNLLDRSELQTEYISALRKYEGVQYVWGGENGVGIDCSGLCRRSMIDALNRCAIRHLDPSILRTSIDLWWHDTTAERLGECERNLTVPVMEASSINAIDRSEIELGDMGVTGSGVHILAYLGGSDWIQAEPSAGEVIRNSVPSKNGWFQQRVTVVRWRWLAGSRYN